MTFQTVGPLQGVWAPDFGLTFLKQEAVAVTTVKQDAVTATTTAAVVSIRLRVNVKICPKLRGLDLGF